MSDIITQPIKFLGATVLSFNATLGFGSTQETTINVDLVEDCANGDLFYPNNGLIFVGGPVYFSAGAFNFGGILTNWTVSQGGGGKTFNVRAVDPRSLLENSVVIIDTYLGPPTQGINYFNVYAGYESPVLNGNCQFFGSSLGNERGMPYQAIISKLQQMNPTIYSPTGYAFTVNFSSFPTGLPEYYRVPGPQITLLQLLQDVCDILGYDFYVDLLPGGIISVGLVNLRQQPTSFNSIISAYNGIATDLSYGQELRNEKTRTVLFGEKQHYLAPIDKFNFFFGEDLINNEMVPVIPFREDSCGFWINKKVDSLNAALTRPLPTNGPYEISELDIRAALSSYKLWKNRVLTATIPGSFNEAIRANWPEAAEDLRAAGQVLANGGDAIKATENPQRGFVDQMQNARKPAAKSNKPEFLNDLEKVFNFVKNLGSTYYGKQFFVPLNQRICYYRGDDFQEIIFSDVPTNDGGWVEEGVPVLGLADPELSAFREEDNRVGCFAVFAFNAAEAPIPETSEEDTSTGPVSIPDDSVFNDGSIPPELPS
jgi:hypothetical protein